jgi:Tol biopolymer transport system component
VQPFWSADGSQVRYIDRPSSGQPSGIWGVSASGGQPSFVTARLGIYSPDDKLVAYPEGGQTYIERVGGERWTVDNGGRAIVFSPEGSQVAWQAASSLVNFDTRQVQIWVAGVDGSGARKVAELEGGGLAGWFPDGRRLLVTSRDGDFGLVQALKIDDGRLALIARAPHIQGAVLSPQGGWVAYAIAFSGDAGLDGLWVAPADGGAAQRLDAFGGFAWRAEGRLLIIPLEASASGNRLLEIEAATGVERSLASAAATRFQIAGGNWALSPDGSHLAFVSATDHNIWILDMPE